MLQATLQQERQYLPWLPHEIVPPLCAYTSAPWDINGYQWISCVKMCQDVSRCVKMRQDASRCVKMRQDASRCVKMRQDVSRCVKMCQDVSRCVKVCQDVSRCVKMCQDVSSAVGRSDMNSPNSSQAFSCSCLAVLPQGIF